MKKMYPGIESLLPADRLKTLEENAYEMGEENVRRNFTEEEISNMKSNLSDETILKLDAEEELKELSAPLKSVIKTKTDTIKKVSANIRNGYYDSFEKVFYMADHTEGDIHCYDASGALLHSRPMTQREKQTKLRIAN